MSWSKSKDALVREPVVAGAFYPGDREKLAKDLERFFSRAPKRKENDDVLALICPHAGYPYSGQVAAQAYKQLEGRKIDTVVLIGPSHRAYFEGISVFDKGFWKTPLGTVEVNSDIAQAIMKENPEVLRYIPSAHREEHSLEVQLPFLQWILKDFKIVPICMGDQSLSSCKILSGALSKALLNKNVILVASSDLYHGYSYEECKRLDRILLDCLEAFDPEGLSKDLAQERTQACGGGPIVATLLTAKLLGGKTVKVLEYTNSGDVTGDRSGYIVGYCASAIYKSLESKEKKRKNPGLSEEEKRVLLKIARTSIEQKLKGERVKEIPVDSPLLKEKRGAFVTLKERGMLRGCIGYMQAIKPLYQTVSEMAVAAATGDPRFMPVTLEELPHLEIEISVLSPLKKITDPSEIQVGVHGVLVERGGRSGVFLPQVATEEGWERVEFLENLCAHKAGLPRDAWKDKETNIYIFTAEVFKE